MSTVVAPDFKQNAPEPVGVRLHRFTVDEYHRIFEAGVLPENDPVELLDGKLFIKLEEGPPYEVPLGIPPEAIAGPKAPRFPQRRFTVREYHQLLASGALPPTLRTELIEGWVVDKMTRNAGHDSSLSRTAESLQDRLPQKWKVRQQSAVSMDEAEPEPDVTVVPGPKGRFDHMHPRPYEVALLIEISDSALSNDRGSKLRDYARNSIRRHWIVNLIERTVEAYDDPTGPIAVPAYGNRQVYRPKESIPLLIGDEAFDAVPVEDLFPAVH